MVMRTLEKDKGYCSKIDINTRALCIDCIHVGKDVIRVSKNTEPDKPELAL